MKKFILMTILSAFIALPAMAAEPAAQSTAEKWLKPVEAQYVCMVNNKVFDKPQMLIEAEGKSYYGCCAMCVDKIKTDASQRSATDPVSGALVDKATAVIGADVDGVTYYFESLENLNTYASTPKPEAHGSHGETAHDHEEGGAHE